MELNTWYQQTFSDKVIYFYALKRQKNGGWAGIQVDVYPGSRAKPKGKKSSVPNTAHNLQLWSKSSYVIAEVELCLGNLYEKLEGSFPSDNG